MFYGLEFEHPNILSIADMGAIIFYFIVYSFLGWMLENSFSLLTKHTFFKPGFFVGPFKPMYGIAPVLLICLVHADTNWMILLILCFVIPSFVEYMSGYLLKKFFRRRWWDYTDIPLQLHGHICLIFSFCWLFLSLVCLKFLHPIIFTLYRGVESSWLWLCPVVLCYLLIEMYFAIRRHSQINPASMKTTDTIQ
ncbi:putative ABC transporter permease [Cytobacillus sp. Hz8]|uniref:putative ABC transporter permease n=1 Tax=Cytobacillus sp. Hz8 TaxID=3347168 RepID=UPI0035DD7C83